MRRIVVVARFCSPAQRAGGPPRSLEALFRRYSGAAEIRLIASGSDLGAPLPPTAVTGRWTPLTARTALYRVTGSMDLIWTTWRTVRTADAVYVNSLFDARFVLPALILGRLRGSCLVYLAPRGELSPAALSSRPWRKHLYRIAIRAAGLLHGVTLHATSGEERATIHAAMPGARVVEAANDTLVTRSSSPARAEGVRPRLVFVGRLSAHKGLHVALAAMAELVAAGSLPVGAHLDVCGATRRGEAAYAAACEAQASQLPPTVTVTFHDWTPPSRIGELLAAADAMILPTKGENFGHAIIEALALGCPVVLTDTTPWSWAAEETGTLVADLEPRSWAAAVAHVVNLPLADRVALRARAGDCFERWSAARVGAESILDIIDRDLDTAAAAPAPRQQPR